MMDIIKINKILKYLKSLSYDERIDWIESFSVEFDYFEEFSDYLHARDGKTVLFIGIIFETENSFNNGEGKKFITRSLNELLNAIEHNYKVKPSFTEIGL